MLETSIKRLLAGLGLDVRRVQRPPRHVTRDLPDGDLYRPLFSPWTGHRHFERYYRRAAPRSLVSPDRCHVLYALLQQAVRIDGHIWECGVYKGGTAAMMADLLRDVRPSKKLFLFDTFEGMPETDPDRDWHSAGDFSDTSLEAVRSYVGHGDLCLIRKGFIPETFAGLEEERIALAHIDLDIYRSIRDSLQFIWPRVTFGGFVILDDYGFPSCPGARAAVDEFFAADTCVPLCLPTGQAVVFKGVG